MATLPIAAVEASGSEESGLADGLAVLVEAARRGDGEAFAALHRRFAPVVHGIVLARAGRGEVEDVVQEVFASVHASLATLGDARAFPGWIASIARNASTDRLRRRAREPKRGPLDDVAAREAPRGDGVLRERVLAHIQALPDAYREPLVLRLVEGLTGPAIAERTGMTPASVRVNLHRGMAMLRPLLEREGWR